MEAWGTQEITPYLRNDYPTRGTKKTCFVSRIGHLYFSTNYEPDRKAQAEVFADQ